MSDVTAISLDHEKGLATPPSPRAHWVETTTGDSLFDCWMVRQIRGGCYVIFTYQWGRVRKNNAPTLARVGKRVFATRDEAKIIAERMHSAFCSDPATMRFIDAPTPTDTDSSEVPA